MDENKEKESAFAKSFSATKEEAILKFWKENKIFEKSLAKNSPKGEYVFYEGPPTANGKPGIHHLEARAFKDAIPRYKTMCGYHVRRKGGWDTHGLPVELQVEKKLGLTSKKAIEDYGIAKFNKECKESVWEYTDLWEKFTDRIGYWVDQENPYVTYHNNYIESVWNVIKTANDKNLLYKDYKVVPWCPRCGTTLSSHELAQGYEDVKDLSVYVKFRVVSSSDTFPQVLGRGGREPVPDHSEKHTEELPVYILAWTTTPWTLPGNVALAIGEKMDYVKIILNNEFLILNKDRLSIIEGDYKIVEEFKGKDLIGLEYEPLYPYLKETISDKAKSSFAGSPDASEEALREKGKLEKAYKVYGADFVTTEDGTGIVHTAVMYGVDDFNLGTEIGLPKHHLVGLDGKFLDNMDFLSGRFVRDEETAVEIIKDLSHRGLLFKKEKYEHSYPHCWRCKTALIYYARDSWYIKMSALRDQMVKENESINWEPSYIKEGRFGEWLKEIKDWAISRERYWGTPFPVWKCDKCNKIDVVGSMEQLKSKIKKSGNKYFVMRHGEAESNILEIMNSEINSKPHLTLNGQNQVLESIKNFKDVDFDIIISSPFVRAKETAEIVRKELGFSEDIIFDNRLKEINVGDYDGKRLDSFKDRLVVGDLERLEMKFPNGESHNDVRKRVGNFIYDIESKYSNKKILIIAHGDVMWMLQAVSRSLSKEETIELKKNYPKNAEIKELDFSILPHNENYELDLHKPYIDEVELVCDCGGKLQRSKEVMDVWLDSGTMPFSQDHYPFEGKDIAYPADFISEAIDQTRGWFYTLHAVGAIMGKGKAYKNVICLGHLLDAKGKKMSKSLGNVVDPWEMMEKYGADTLRLWMYSVNQPGESKNFDEKTVAELHNKVFNLLYNVLAFYELYRDEKLEREERSLRGLSQGPSLNILDRWILAKLNKLTKEITNNLDNYKLLEPVRAIRDFIDQLSTWYVRRSRERLKNGDVEAKKTLYYVLKNLIKLMAPFAPFTAEDIWQKLKQNNDPESVHLAKWPGSNQKSFIIKFILKKIKIDGGDVINEMEETRKVVTLGLQARQKANLPVRQPLNKLNIIKIKIPKKYLDIIKDEMNVKNITFDVSKIATKEPNVEIDTNITEELKQEGNYRELVRAIQDMRKKEGLSPNDIVNLEIKTDKKGEALINQFKTELLKVLNVKEIKMGENEGEAKFNEIKSPDASEEAFREIKIGEMSFVISII